MSMNMFAARAVLLALAVLVLASCAARHLDVDSNVRSGDTNRMADGGRCRLLELAPVGPDRVQMLCAGTRAGWPGVQARV